MGGKDPKPTSIPRYANSTRSSERASVPWPTRLSPLQKCTSAIRQLAYGTPADALDEYLKIAESTSVKCLKLFVEGVIHIFGDEYMRKPNVNDVQRLLDIGESRGFPGMLGSLDCMHWRWDKCPMEWKGQSYSYSRGGCFSGSLDMACIFWCCWIQQ